jgi:hypothetical protein
MLAERIPVRWNDFSQSAVDGPRMLPSMYASPGQRVQVPTWLQVEQTGRSLARIERTSFSSEECRQISLGATNSIRNRFLTFA